MTKKKKMKFRLFSDEENEFKNSGVKIYKEIGIHWFVDTTIGFMPSHDADYQVQSDFRLHYKIKEWCEEQCNGNVGCVLGRRYWEAPTYYFADEEDAVQFRLTWC